MADEYDEYDEIYKESELLSQAQTNATGSNSSQVKNDVLAENSATTTAGKDLESASSVINGGGEGTHSESPSNVFGKSAHSTSTAVHATTHDAAVASGPTAANATMPTDASADASINVMPTTPTRPVTLSASSGNLELQAQQATQQADDVHPMEVETQVNTVNQYRLPWLVLIAKPHQNAATQPEVKSVQVSPKLKQEPDAEFLEAATANKDNPAAEWQFDSSDAMSTSDSSSDSDSDDDSDDPEGEYAELDPATAAKMLMAGEQGEDDGDSGNKGGLKTKNEKTEDIVPKPDFTLTADMRIIPLGIVEHIVETFAVIKAFTSGEYRVLEYGSALCLENRTIVGAVMETMGKVQEPRYTVAFTNKQEIDDMGLTHGTKIFYVEQHSTFVFTEPLQKLKGTDASNIYDEEVGEDELEFSDDEMESAWKKYKKQNRQGHRSTFLENYVPPGDDNQETRGYGRGGNGRGHHVDNDTSAQRPLIKYDDDDDDDMYTPLTRPSNYNETANGRHGLSRGRGERGGGRGRGGRGRDDRGRGDRSYRGGNQSGGNRGHHAAAQPYPNHSAPIPPPGFYPPSSTPDYGAVVPPPPPGWPQQQPAGAQSYQAAGLQNPYAYPPLPAAIPPGSHVNPAFFANGGGQQSHHQAPQQYHATQPSYPMYPYGQAQTGQDQAAALQALMQYFQQNGTGTQQNGSQR
ncbi:H/ACA ribonucleoprotein complex non-core subunit NAF1-like protein [Elsinoe fawcettii]|nr:H/ACA ribonucleoprotein complex non-core subunit NAF1-like protein [Elsinoe fawcettii]